MKPRKAVNPFYILLVVVGVAFAVTACAYGVMTVKMLHPEQVAELPEGEGGLLEFLDRHGFQVMLAQLAVLAVATLAAILTDDFWVRRAARSRDRAARVDAD